MRVVVTTPAGRKKYLTILYKHLAKQKHRFSEWQLWVNTLVEEDIDFCLQLAEENDWITIKRLTVPHQGNFSICSFFSECIDEDALYIRIDDDVCWLEEDFIYKLTQARIKNPDAFLVYPNIINNSIIDHINQRLGNIDGLKLPEDLIGYDVMDRNGWERSDLAEIKHRSFIKRLEKNQLDDYKFTKWNLYNYEGVSINCISWFGKDFAEFNGIVDREDEHWLAHVKPKSCARPNLIVGDPICVHFAFYTQREYLETTDLLDIYETLV
jgi:hypothetical protein